MNTNELTLKHKRERVFFYLEILTDTRRKKLCSIQNRDERSIDYYGNKEIIDKENLEKAEEKHSE